MVECLSLKEVTALVKCTTVRGAEAWCARAGVPVYTDAGGKRYVVQADVVRARLQDFLRHLKNQHGAHWRAVFEAYLSNDVLRLSAFEETPSRNEPAPHTGGKHENRFLKALTESIHEQQCVNGATAA